MSPLKITNEYAGEFGRDYDRIPKAVFAAVAFSLCMKISGDLWETARLEFFEEWERLNQNGIVPQKVIVRREK